MHGADGTLQEAAFAVAQIVFPQAFELLVKAFFAQFWPGFKELLTPVSQGFSIVQTDVMHFVHHHVGIFANALAHALDRWQAATWEDIGLDKVHIAAVVVVALIGNSDGLQ